MQSDLTIHPSWGRASARPAVSSSATAKAFQAIAEAPDSIVDAALLLSLWLLVLATSVRFFGAAGAALYLVLAGILVLRSTTNGLLLLILIFYSPAVTVGVPNVFVVTTAMAAARLVFDLSSQRLAMLTTPVLYATAAFVLFAGCMTILSHNFDSALYYYKKDIEGLSLLVLTLLAVRTTGDIGRLFRWWALFAGLAAFVKAAHLLIGNDTVLYRTMQAAFAHDRFDLEHRTHIMIGWSTARRFLLPGEEPNYVSAGLVFPFAIALGFANVARGLRKLPWIAISTLIAVSVVGTYSRSGFLAIVAVLVLFGMRGGLLRALIPAAILGTCFVAAVTLIPVLHARVFGIGNAIDSGATGRFNLWQLALDLWLQSPLFGNGTASFYQLYESAVHNTYLQILAELGLIGLGLFLWTSVATIQANSKFRRAAAAAGNKSDLRFNAALLAGFLGFSLMIATVTYQDVKLYWLACASLAALARVQHLPAGLAAGRIGIEAADQAGGGRGVSDAAGHAHV